MPRPCAIAVALALAALAPAGARGQGGPSDGALDPRALAEAFDAVAVPRDLEEEGAFTGSDPVDALLGLPIAEVRAVDPPAGFDPVADAEIPLGAVLDRALVRAAVRKLWATGSYGKIGIGAERRADGAAVILRVEALLRIREIAVEGNDAMSDEDVARALGRASGSTIEPTTDALLALRDALLAAYADRGYRDARAALTIETTATAGNVTLAVEVDEGPPDRWVEVRIAGLPDDVPLRAILGQAKLSRGTVRDQARLEASRAELVEALAGFGYRDAAIGGYSERRLGEHDFALEIDIAAGIPTALVFEGGRRVRRAELEDVVLAKGDLRTTAASLEIARSRVVAHLVRQGLLHASVRVERRCYDEASRLTRAAGLAPCPRGAVRQDVVFVADEGVPVIVAAVAFSGNSRIGDEELERELFAFVASRNARDEVFQPINTRTVDSLGVSYSRPSGVGRPRGALAPPTAPRDVYVPEVYRAAAAQLTDLYRGRGFLSARVTDACDLETRAPVRERGEWFAPFAVRRAPAEGEDPERALPPCVFLNEDRDLLLVAFGVEEGPETQLSRVGVRGNDPVHFTERALIELAGLAPGEPYNEYDLRVAARDIKAAYGRAGFVFADVAWKSAVSKDGTAADVSFTVREGPRAKVKRILVRGNAATSRRLILDRLALEPGDVITPEALAESERRLMELGIFDSATVQLAAENVPAGEKNVVVHVTEGKPQYLDLRAGVATVEGVRGGFEYGYRNLGGLAISARLRVRANYRILFPGQALADFERRYEELAVVDRIERHILAGVSTQHVPGTGGLLGLGIDAINERTNSPAFSADRTSGYLRATSIRLRQLPVEVRTGVEWTILDLPDLSDVSGGTSPQASPQFQKWALLPEGESLFSVTGLTVSLDFRDDVFNPSRGVFATINADYVRSLAAFGRQVARDAEGEPIVDATTGETQYVERLSNLIRAEASLSGYIPLVGQKMVLALSSSVGYVFHLEGGSTTWADRYFYMGGVSTLRGFAEDSLVPEDVYQAWKRQIRSYDDAAAALLAQRGGEALFLARAELRFPLAKGFYGAAFGEAGNIWRDQHNLLDRFAVRPVAGLGLSYMTPIGPLAFDVGANLDKRPHEDRVAWFLSIGSAF